MADKAKNIAKVEVAVGEISKREYLQGTRMIFWQVYGLFPFPIAAIAMLYGVFGVGQDIVPMPTAFIILAVLILLPLMFEGFNRLNFRRYPYTKQVLVYTFDAEGWKVKHNENTVSHTWLKTIKMRENKDALFLYPTKRTVNIVPKRFMGGKERNKIVSFYQDSRSKTKN